MNPAAPDGAPRGGSVSVSIFAKHRTAPPCLGEALRGPSRCELPFMPVQSINFEVLPGKSEYTENTIPLALMFFYEHLGYT